MSTEPDPACAAPAAARQASLEQCVRDSLNSYFRDLGGESPDRVYDMVVRLVERPLLEVVMHHAQHNQSRAAQWLGLNRNTLRKKLLDHQLLDVEKNQKP